MAASVAVGTGRKITQLRILIFLEAQEINFQDSLKVNITFSTL